jgi:hypothetical protein
LPPARRAPHVSEVLLCPTCTLICLRLISETIYTPSRLSIGTMSRQLLFRRSAPLATL